MSKCRSTGQPELSFTGDSDTGMYYAGSSDIEFVASGISINQDLLDKIDRMEKMINTMAERLAVLDEPSDEQLEKQKMLKEAYTKYKFIEKLCQEEDDES